MKNRIFGYIQYLLLKEPEIKEGSPGYDILGLVGKEGVLEKNIFYGEFLSEYNYAPPKKLELALLKFHYLEVSETLQDGHYYTDFYVLGEKAPQWAKDLSSPKGSSKSNVVPINVR